MIMISAGIQASCSVSGLQIRDGPLTCGKQAMPITAILDLAHNAAKLDIISLTTQSKHWTVSPKFEKAL